MRMRAPTCLAGAVLTCLWLAPGALAHEGPVGHVGHVAHLGHGFAAGFVHPLLGLDHLLAVVFSGLLAVRLRNRRSLWFVPVTFAALMLVGVATALAGVAMPRLEPALEFGLIAAVLSLAVAAVAVAAAPAMPLTAGAALVGAVAILHGHTHAHALGQGSPAVLSGMVLSTLALHGAAIVAGRGAAAAARRRKVRRLSASPDTPVLSRA